MTVTIRLFQPVPEKAKFIYKINLIDIQTTVYNAILNLPDNCVGITISKDADRATAEEAAKIKGIELFWSTDL